MFGVYWRAAKGAFATIGDTNMSLISAGVAFFSMLSLFPALAALIAILGLMLDPEVVVTQMEELRGLLPADVFTIIKDQVVSLVTHRADRLGWASLVSLLVALWSARAGVGAMIVGLNSVQSHENRGLTRHYARALLLTVALIVVGIIAVLSILVAPVVLSFIPLGPYATLMAEITRWGVAILVILIGIALLYRYGPNRPPSRSGLLTPGAVFAVISWAGVSMLFSVYVSNFANYNKVYGSIGAVAAMMVWMWLSTFLVLLGAAFNKHLELGRSSQ